MRAHPAVVVAVVLAVAVALWLAFREDHVRLQDLELVDMAPAFPPANTRPRRAPPRFIVIHHSATGSAEATRRVLTKAGKSTHFEVEKDGTILRYLDPQTTVAEQAGWINGASIGIDVTHITNAAFTEAQVAATARLVAALCAEFNIPRVVAPDGVRWDSAAKIPGAIGVLRHRNARPTECPQDFPMARLGPVYAGAVA